MTCAARAAVVLLVLLGLVPGVWAQAGDQSSQPSGEPAPAQPAPAQAVTADAVKAAIAGLESQTGLDDPTRQAVLEAYNEALANLQRRDDAARRLADFQRLAVEAPALLDSIRAELATPPADVVPQLPENPTLQQMEQGLAQAQAELTAARQQADDLQAEATRRTERRPAINEQLSQSRKLLLETDEALRTLAAADSPFLTDARRLSLQTRRDALDAEIKALEAETGSYDARRDLLPARRDRAVRRVTTAQKLVDQWQVLVSEKRQREAESALTEAERLGRDARQHPVLRAFAEETERLASLRLGEKGTTQELSKLADRLRRTRQELSSLREGYQSIQRRIQATDLNRATGLLLRRQYDQMSNPADLRRDYRGVTKELEEAEIDWIERDEQRSGSGDINQVVEDLLSEIEQQREDVHRVVVEMLSSSKPRQYASDPKQAIKETLGEIEKVAGAGAAYQIATELLRSVGPRPAPGDTEQVLGELTAELVARPSTGASSEIIHYLLVGLKDRTEVAVPNRSQLESVAHDLATNRRDVLGTLVKDASDRFQALLELSDSSKELLDSVVAYRSYIEERILWIRSISQERLPSFDEVANDVGWLVDPDAWRSAGVAVAEEFVRNPVVMSSVPLWVVLLFLVAQMARNRLREVAARVASYRTDSFALSALGVFYTFVAASPLPALFYAVGWILLRPSEQAEPIVAVGSALEQSGMLAFVLMYSRLSVIPKGIFDAHFRWPSATLRSIRAHLRWFIPVVLPLVVLGGAVQRQSAEEFAGTIGRTAFTAHMIVLGLLCQRLLRPAGPIMGEYHKRHEGALLYRGRYAIYLLAVGLPIGLAVLSWLGYHYTALQLFTRVQHSLFVVVALILVYSLLQRWLFIARRKVAIDDARRKREQSQGESKSAGERAGMPDEERFDLPAISAQTQQLFRVSIFLAVILGFYAIWAPTLPALRMLERVQVYPALRVVQTEKEAGVTLLDARLAVRNGTSQTGGSAPVGGGEQSSGASPAQPALNPSVSGGTLTGNGVMSQTPKEDASVPRLEVNLADVGLALIVLIATIMAFRNVPGLVEIVVLQRLPLDAGSRYALSTVLRYVIAIIGVTIAFNAVGISWGKVQWLAAALTFGLAFGLQEIFANFVSGLIILAERPIRVGDTVTVNAVTGSVTRIRMRATTILDWDRKELVIPNKSFITDQVINWTLTDPVLRVIVPVGVSYNSDVDQVESLLMRVASQNALVLREPRPQVLFLGFGDSTLNFEVRIFIPSIDHLVTVKHQMHNAIIKLFREAGIEIAFPQRDLHIRTADAQIRFVQTSSDGHVDAMVEESGGGQS